MIEFVNEISGKIISVRNGTDVCITFPVNKNFHISLILDDSCGEGKVRGDGYIATTLMRSYLRIYKKNAVNEWEDVTKHCFGEDEVHAVDIDDFIKAIEYCKIQEGEL